jgi:hypothetical protein
MGFLDKIKKAINNPLPVPTVQQAAPAEPDVKPEPDAEPEPEPPSGPSFHWDGSNLPDPGGLARPVGRRPVLQVRELEADGLRERDRPGQCEEHGAEPTHV